MIPLQRDARHEVIPFGNNDWLPFPISDDPEVAKPFFSSTEVKMKVVYFDMTTNLCPGVTESFAVTFEPGIPSRICLLGLPSGDDQEQMVVQNGESLQTLTVACFDSFNNRTDPNKVLLADGDEGWTPRRDTLCL